MKWELSSPNMSLVKELMIECGITELQAKLLVNRGIENIDAANMYLYGDLRDLYDPGSLAGIEKAVDILEDAYKRGMSIFVSGDYDVDGVFATNITYKALDYVGIKTEYYIPHRVKEGYGLSKKSIDVAKEKKYDIIYTVDNGIAAVEEIKYAKELGFDVIVTDHHDIPDILPCADAIINPKLPECKYPNKKLCGCSVSWKVLYHFYKRIGADINYLYSLLPYVAFATIGDMMDLDGENRLIVKEGLKILNQKPNMAFSKMKDIFKIKEYKAETGAFILCPIVNCDGRLYSGYIAAEYFLCRDIEQLEIIKNVFLDIFNRQYIDANSGEEVITINKDKYYVTETEKAEIYKQAVKVFGPAIKDNSLDEIFLMSKKKLIEREKEIEQQANTLYEINEKRKEMTLNYYNECIEMIENNKFDEYEIIVLVHDNIPEGLVGLVAGRVKEKYQKPTFIFSNAEKYIKGSGRGVEGHPFSLFEGLNITKDLWTKGGGHPMAAGVSFEKDITLIDKFRDRLHKYIKELLKDTVFTPKTFVDGVINVPDENLCRSIELLEPCGKGNRSALFVTDPLNLREAKPVGDGSHLRVTLTNNIAGIGFSLTNKYNELGNPNRLSFAYTPSINEYTYVSNYTGKEVTNRSVQMMIQDINSAEERVTNNKKMLISSIKQNVNKRR